MVRTFVKQSLDLQKARSWHRHEVRLFYKTSQLDQNDPHNRSLRLERKPAAKKLTRRATQLSFG